MIKVTLVHDLRCSKERFWKLFFDPDFTREMILDGLDFATCEIEPIKASNGIRRRAMEVKPKLDLPAAVKKLLGPKLGYREEATFDEATEEWRYTIHLNMLGDRIKLGGKMTIEEGTAQRCRRHSDLWVEARIFGLGGVVEKAAEKNMRDGWNKSATWINGWLAKHPEATDGPAAEAAD